MRWAICSHFGGKTSFCHQFYTHLMPTLVSLHGETGYFPVRIPLSFIIGASMGDSKLPRLSTLRTMPLRPQLIPWASFPRQPYRSVVVRTLESQSQGQGQCQSQRAPLGFISHPNPGDFHPLPPAPPACSTLRSFLEESRPFTSHPGRSGRLEFFTLNRWLA